MPENKPAKAVDELLVQRHVGELVHRAQETETAAAILIVAGRILGACALEDDVAFEESLKRFRADARMARIQMRAALKANAMIERARGGGHAH